MTVIALVLALLLPQGSPPPLALLESGMLTESGYVSLLTIGPDGRWTAPSDQKGELAPEELAQIKDGVQRMVLGTSPGPRCTEVATLQLVRVARGEVRYAPVCGPKADASVIRLIELASSFTVRKPSAMVVRFDRWEPGKEDRKQSVRLMRDGVWSTDNGVGNTGGQELADLMAAFEATVVEAQRGQPGCVARMILDVEVPNRGRLRWSAPCDTPSPTLDLALTKLKALVGLTP